MASFNPVSPVTDGVAIPDIMNDPAFATNGPAAAKNPEDPDTCRICRGEGTKDEALFYPCKCSGSIKYVHQECLMEWLSHSQKKHCELCKTPFRFTKLYHPHMPKSLPTTVFLRRAVVHLAKHMLTWCRGLLVGTVWLFGLPWLMRFIWRSLFWLGDGGWARDIRLLEKEALAATALNASAIPAAPGRRLVLEDANSTLAKAATGLLAPISQTLNMTAGEPIAISLAKKILYGLDVATKITLNGSISIPNTENSTLQTIFNHKESSLLSDVSLFNSVKEWSPTWHRAILDILEGQVITLSVVVAFILIFLIREWVVQQQPLVQVAHHQVNHAAAQAGGHAEGVNQEQATDQETGLAQDDGTDVDMDPERLANLRTAREIVALLPDDLQAAVKGGRPSDVVDTLNRMPPEKADRCKASIKLMAEQKLEVIAQYPDELQSAINGGRPSDIMEYLNRLSREEFDILKPKIERVNEQIVAPSRHLRRPLASEHDQPEGSSLSLRPSMPVRARSSLATNIKRDMEEEATLNDGTNSDIEYETTLSDDAGSDIGEASTAEQKGTDSTGSWEDVANSERTAEATSFRRWKGKERARDDHEASSGATSSLAVDSVTELDDDMSADSGVTVVDNPFHPDYRGDAFDRSNETRLALANQEPATHQQPEAAQPQSFSDRIADWFWGDVAPIQPVANEIGDNVEHVVQDLADEAPFVPFAHAQPFNAPEPEPDGNQPVQDPEVAAAAAQAGIDVNNQDDVDDAEDLEGIMELIGMQGPITGLIQNLLFSAVLITGTVVGAVWLPYLWGKVVLLIMGSPVSLLLKYPLRIASAVADFIVDICLLITSSCIYCFSWACSFLWQGITHGSWTTSLGSAGYPFNAVGIPAQASADNAAKRLVHTAIYGFLAADADTLYFSQSSHAALRAIQNKTSEYLYLLGNMTAATYHGTADVTPKSVTYFLLSKLPQSVASASSALIDCTKAAVAPLIYNQSLTVSVNTTASGPLDPDLVYWSASDRAVAVLAGYAFFAFISALYLRRGTPLTSSVQGRKIETTISEILQQAGGVIKVIIIISIEMIAFPLFCGFLLDFALLPLFESATFGSRVTFTLGSPWTSGFVHWFIGTCYMFHFALFVSMCRKIMRSGVLYFIRDPDDPSFHPVRDVLERSIATQLRKIAFSAIVYGALIVLCLGGVVWSLWWAFDQVLPIHWASNESPLEFPLDILFYNLLTPLIVRYTRPTDGLHAMYKWWFRRCAHYLRLSDFLFGDKRKDEEGHHVRQTWAQWLAGIKGNVEEPIVGADDSEDKTDVYFLFDGKYVKAPASDQVRIPKGQPVFLDIQESEHPHYQKKPSGTESSSDDSSSSNNTNAIQNGTIVHPVSSSMPEKYTSVYIPPFFRLRIALFICTIWLFAAATGVAVTILPLIFGRFLIASLSFPTSRTNDIYAFSLGIYILGGLLYTACHYAEVTAFLRSHISPAANTTTAQVLTQAKNYSLQALRILYVYGLLTLVLPLLFAAVLEAYVLIPVHTYLGPRERHVVHLIQDWTLGILYAKIASRIVTWNHESRIARAAAAIVAAPRNGFLNPNARIATRCFVLPIGLFFAFVLATPFLGGAVAVRTFYRSEEDEVKRRVVRYAYPLALAVGIDAWVLWSGMRVLGRWRARIRDEVYLVGERLHNFGESKRGTSKADVKVGKMSVDGSGTRPQVL